MHRDGIPSAPRPAATTSAGLRGTHWDPAKLPADVRISVHSLRTHDGANVVGFLMCRGGETAVVAAMHPREMTVPQYMALEVLEAGCAFWVQGSRTPNSDLRLEHETALLDLAAGQRFLRQQGFAKVVLQGTSGGGHWRPSIASRLRKLLASAWPGAPAGDPWIWPGPSCPRPTA